MKFARDSQVPKEEAKKALAESTRMVVTADGWKLSLRDRDLNELYQVHRDPWETENVIDLPENREVVARLTDEIKRWQVETGDRSETLAPRHPPLLAEAKAPEHSGRAEAHPSGGTCFRMSIFDELSENPKLRGRPDVGP